MVWTGFTTASKLKPQRPNSWPAVVSGQNQLRQYTNLCQVLQIIYSIRFWCVYNIYFTCTCFFAYKAVSCSFVYSCLGYTAPYKDDSAIILRIITRHFWSYWDISIHYSTSSLNHLHNCDHSLNNLKVQSSLRPLAAVLLLSCYPIRRMEEDIYGFCRPPMQARRMSARLWRQLFAAAKRLSPTS